jgi:hypothetical protein
LKFREKNQKRLKKIDFETSRGFVVVLTDWDYICSTNKASCVKYIYGRCVLVLCCRCCSLSRTYPYGNVVMNETTAQGEDRKSYAFLGGGVQLALMQSSILASARLKDILLRVIFLNVNIIWEGVNQ